jgi:hypothetical protein
MIAFKSVLSTITRELTKQMAVHELLLYKKGLLRNDKSINDKFRNKLEEQVEKSLSKYVFSYFFQAHNQNVFTFDISAHIELVRSQNAYKFPITSDAKPEVPIETSQPEGVYLKINTCLPALFESYLKLGKKENPIEDYSEQLKRRMYNCLGHYRIGVIHGQYEWSIRAVAYAPWTTSSQLFFKGVNMPPKVSYLDSTIVKATVQNKVYDLELPFREEGGRMRIGQLLYAEFGKRK